MKNDAFSLPASSLEEVEKIIQAHAQRNQPSNNDDIAKLAGLASSTVSRNNAFLVSIGLLREGKKKEPTELGVKLGHALHHGEEEETRRFWREAVTNNQFLSDQLAAVRVQKGVETDKLPGKILYNSGATRGKYTETGSRTVADILVRANLIEQEEGLYQVALASAANTSDTEPSVLSDQHQPVAPSPTSPRSLKPTGSTPVQLAVNLQIQLPEFEDASKYEELFRALRKHLIAPEEEA